MKDTALTVFSFGGGQDSFAILYKIVYDKGFRDKYVSGRLVVVMAETGNEHKETYEAVSKVKEFCLEHNIEFIHLDYTFTPKVWKGGLIAFYRRYNRVGSKAFPKICTDNLKIKPIYSWLEYFIHTEYKTTKYGKKSAFKEFVQDHGKIRMLIGIASGEEKRVSDSTEGLPKWFIDSIDKVFPLITEGMDRKACQEYIVSLAKELPPPSNCIVCPFLSKQELLYMYRFNRRWYNTFVDLENKKIINSAFKLDRSKTINAKGKIVDNMGVFGKKLLPEILQEAISEFGHWTDEQLKEYKMSHGHCVKSKY